MDTSGDVIELFLNATKDMTTMELVRRWVAISMVGGAASRKVWTSTYRGKRLHANMFIMLVGEPGMGKTDPVEMAEECLAEMQLPDGHVVFTPAITTPAAFMKRFGATFNENDEAQDANPRKFQTVYALISEWSSFTMDQEVGQFYQALADLWEWKPDKPFVKDTKGQGTDRAYNPYLSILAGVQPKWFSVGMPKGGFNMGFSARMLWVPSDGGTMEKKFFTPAPVREVKAIQDALKQVREREGEVLWSPDAKSALHMWWKGGGQPRPKDLLLQNYCTRRDMHLGKVAFVSALSRNAARVEMEDFQRALGWLLELEAAMPRAIALAGENPLSGVADVAVEFVADREGASGAPVPETALRRYIARLVRPQEAVLLVNELIAQGRLIVTREVLPPHRTLRVGRDLDGGSS